MNKVRIIGDIHGHFSEYKAIAEAGIAEGCTSTIQVGDFGIGFAGPHWHSQVDEFHENGIHRFIRGNHDCPTRNSGAGFYGCAERPGWIPDGRVENDVMFIGGAWSIDWKLRTEGVTWWHDEELSMEELYLLIDVYDAVKPRVMITHDAPLSVTEQMFIKSGNALFGRNAKSITTRTGAAFETMFALHQPDEWYFGHWHQTVAQRFGRTTFQCIGELEYVDVDLDE